MVEENQTIEYKASYWPKDQNPFAERVRVLTRTVRIDASIPLEEVERLAREACGDDRFISVKAVG